VEGGGGCGGRERGREPAKKQSALPDHRRPLGGRGRKEGRTDGPDCRPSAPQGPTRPLIPPTSPRLVAVPSPRPPAPWDGCVSQPRRRRRRRRLRRRPSDRSAPSRKQGAGPRSPLAFPAPRSPLGCRARLLPAELTGEASPCALQAAPWRWRQQRRGSRLPGPALCCSAQREPEAGGSGRWCKCEEAAAGPGNVRRRGA
jgi:hypothetical protein